MTDKPLTQDETSLKRMQWRCRRGMLELDLLFTPFVETHLPHLNHEQIIALDQLLDMPDTKLWALLSEENAITNATEITPAKLAVIQMLAAKNTPQ